MTCTAASHQGAIKEPAASLSRTSETHPIWTGKTVQNGRKLFAVRVARRNVISVFSVNLCLCPNHPKAILIVVSPTPKSDWFKIQLSDWFKNVTLKTKTVCLVWHKSCLDFEYFEYISVDFAGLNKQNFNVISQAGWNSTYMRSFMKHLKWYHYQSTIVYSNTFLLTLYLQRRYFQPYRVY